MKNNAINARRNWKLTIYFIILTILLFGCTKNNSPHNKNIVSKQTKETTQPTPQSTSAPLSDCRSIINLLKENDIPIIYDIIYTDETDPNNSKDLYI